MINSTKYYVKSSLQKRLTDWLVALKSNSFKETLRPFYPNFKNVFCKYIMVNIRIICNKEEELESWKAKCFSILVSAPNTSTQTDGVDPFIIALGYRYLYDQNTQLQIKSRIQKKKQSVLVYININNIYNELGQTFSKAFPAYDATTGCDYSSFFVKRVKFVSLSYFNGMLIHKKFGWKRRVWKKS